MLTKRNLLVQVSSLLCLGQITLLFEPAIAKELSYGPRPANGAVDVVVDAILSWTSGESAVSHDVYLGTMSADVNNATRDNPLNVLVSRAQTMTEFHPKGLAYGQTYYWRVDEVNAAPDNTIFKGEVWSFTVEPYAYLVKPISVSASSSLAGMRPEKTIDNSGLTDDRHGTDWATMWLSLGTQPNWIQYQFDKVYKLHDLKVWNFNQDGNSRKGDSLTGFGVRKVMIEYSDGITWRTLDNVPEFAQAPGTAGYAADTTVNLAGVMAKYVRLTIQSTWADADGVAGLSEVRFSYVPVQAFAPQPANDARDVSVETSLSWRSGRETALHRVFLGTDPAAVAGEVISPQMTSEAHYSPSNLKVLTTYYWKVDEVNAVTYVGDVWSFTTQPFAVVDDFESYNDTDHHLYDAWIDGRADDKSGSVVGYSTPANGTFGETAIVHGGKQAMPFEYNNVEPPYCSEASRTFDPPQDWTAHGADTLVFYYWAYYVSFLEVGDGSFLINGGGRDIGATSDQFHFVYKQLSGDGSLTMLVKDIEAWDPWAKAGLMVRETLDAGSKNAYIAVTGGCGVTFQWRDTANGATVDSRTAGFKAPYWVRITRSGNVFKAERSADGKAWTQQGTDAVIPMAANVYLGMAVTSHDATEVVCARVSDVSSTGTVAGSWQKSAVGTTLRTNDPDSLYLTVEDATGKSTTVTGGMAADTGGWRWLLVSLKNLGAAGVNLSAVRNLTIGVGDKAGAKPGGTGLIYIDDIGVGRPQPAGRN